MIIVTGAAGFIGSNLITGLNHCGYRDLLLVDDFSRPDHRRNYEGRRFSSMVERSKFPEWIREHYQQIQMIIHLGARTDTTEFSWEVFLELNLDYSKEVFRLCVEYGLPLIYASSAATYGLGEHGYVDSHEVVPDLQPLNPYGRSKNEFDRWVLEQEEQPFFWAGLKFFNVYGPNEYHKGRMASVVFHAFNQIRETGGVKLFRSHHPGFGDPREGNHLHGQTKLFGGEELGLIQHADMGNLERIKFLKGMCASRRGGEIVVANEQQRWDFRF